MTISEDKLARLAAVLFILFVPMMNFAVFSDALRASGDAAELAANIEAHRVRFVAGILLGSIGYVGSLTFGLALYRLFVPVSRSVANLNLAAILTGVPLVLAAFARRRDAHLLFGDMGGLSPASGDWYTQIMAALNGAQSLIGVAGFPWALWGVTLGWLVYRSGFVPRVLGVLLMIGGAFPAFGFVVFALFPDLQENIVALIVGVPMFFAYVIGEYGSILWLLIKGVRRRGIQGAVT